ncbi:MAG: helix-turn-helix domain-containing protein [Kiritimatiellia bacterium]
MPRDSAQLIDKMLETFGRVSGHGAVFHAAGGDGMRHNGYTCAFCRLALSHRVTRGFCRYACLSAGMQTLSSGEPHYQRCWAGLLYVAVAISPQGTYQGAIAVGGFVAAGESDELSDLVGARLAAVPDVDPELFLRQLGSVRAMVPAELRGVGQFLLESTFSGGLNSVLAFQRRHARYEQQRKIADSLAMLRDRSVEKTDVLGDTYRLVTYMHQRDYEGAMQFVSDYLARLLLVSQWNLARLRAHVRVLVAVITSQDILDGADWATASSREMLLLSQIEKARDVESVCYEVAEFVLAHFGRRGGEDIRVSLAGKVMGWLRGHYHERATIQDAAQAIGASVSSISHRLPLETGQTFRQLRLALRITEAKRLLAETDMEISAIADACGFTDQSHFTRHFRHAINMTPGTFRRMLQVVV